jgi:hypothetical protein
MPPIAAVRSVIDGEANILQTASVLGAVVPEAGTRTLVSVRAVVGLMANTHPNALARSAAAAVRLVFGAKFCDGSRCPPATSR